MVKEMEKEGMKGKMENFMKDNLSMIREKELES